MEHKTATTEIKSNICNVNPSFGGAHATQLTTTLVLGWMQESQRFWHHNVLQSVSGVSRAKLRKWRTSMGAVSYDKIHIHDK